MGRLLRSQMIPMGASLHQFLQRVQRNSARPIDGIPLSQGFLATRDATQVPTWAGLVVEGTVADTYPNDGFNLTENQWVVDTDTKISFMQQDNRDLSVCWNF
jgi:hypothetical protein